MTLQTFFLSHILRMLCPVTLQGASHVTSPDTGLLIVAHPPGPLKQWWLLRAIAERIIPRTPPGPLPAQPRDKRGPRDAKLMFFVHPSTHTSSWTGPLMAWVLSPWVSMILMDPADQKGAHSINKASALLEEHLRGKGKALVFPTTYATTGGASPKYHGWSLLAAHQANVPVVALHSDPSPGPHPAHTWRITLLPPRRISCDPDPTPETSPQRDKTHDHIRNRRQAAAAQHAQDLLGEAALTHDLGRYTVWHMLCRAMRHHGRRRLIITDETGQRVTYGQLLTRSLMLGKLFATQTRVGTHVGILLPSTAAAMTTFLALHAFGRIPAMLNFTAGAGPVGFACQTANIQTIYTSRLFVQKAGLGPMVTALEAQATVLFLEDLRKQLNFGSLVLGGWRALFPEKTYRRLNPQVTPDQPAVLLFTSGSEGNPKGVLLSHDNLLANGIQIRTRIDLLPEDVMLNVLPMFHAFGLTIGALLPLLSGLRSHYVPSPLEYTLIPELAHTMQASLLAGTDTFLAGYARTADTCDFYRMRYVFAGAEPLREETQRLWMERFGIRILEGYGTTETSPVLAVNTPMAYRSGTVGRLLPQVEYRMDPVPGITVGGHLSVRGPNIMLGYLSPEGHGHHLPTSRHGVGWYASGDIVSMDAEGFIHILGRAKRFAKIAGEMISLAAVEALADGAWPAWKHAVVSRNDPRKGEHLILVTECPTPDRQTLLSHAHAKGMGKVYLPKKILSTTTLPLLGSGKIDLAAVEALVESRLEPNRDAP